MRLLRRLARLTARRRGTVGLVVLAAVLCLPATALGQGRSEREERPRTRCIPIEVYVDPNVQENGTSATYLRSLMAKRAGVTLTIYDLSVPANRARFD